MREGERTRRERGGGQWGERKGTRRIERGERHGKRKMEPEEDVEVIHKVAVNNTRNKQLHISNMYL